MRPRSTLLLLVVYLELSFCTATEACLTYVSENRYVIASNDRDAAETITASDWAPFDAEASVTWERSIDPEWRGELWWESWMGEGGNIYQAGSQQTSTLAEGGIVSAGGAGEFGPFTAFEGYCQSAMSYFEVRFETTRPGQFVLTGVLFALGDHGGTNIGRYLAWVELPGVFSAEVDSGTFWETFEIPFHETFFLEPGCYTLTAGASAWEDYWGYPGPLAGVGGGGSASYSLNLAPVPIPAPGAVLLVTLGMGLVGWLRRHRAL